MFSSEHKASGIHWAKHGQAARRMATVDIFFRVTQELKLGKLKLKQLILEFLKVHCFQQDHIEEDVNCCDLFLLFCRNCFEELLLEDMGEGGRGAGVGKDYRSPA